MVVNKQAPAMVLHKTYIIYLHYLAWLKNKKAAWKPEPLLYMLSKDYSATTLNLTWCCTSL